MEHAGLLHPFDTKMTPNSSSSAVERWARHGQSFFLGYGPAACDILLQANEECKISADYGNVQQTALQKGGTGPRWIPGDNRAVHEVFRHLEAADMTG